MLADALRAHLGGAWMVRALGASTFCDTWRAESASGVLFVKSAPSARAAVLAAEADGLAALAAPQCIRVPKVIGCWSAGDAALLALEWLDLATLEPHDFGACLGHQLAALHRAAAPGDGRFGWHRDNWLGGTPQRNRWSEEGGREGWLAFVAHERLLALADGLPSPVPAAVRRVVAALPALFDDGHVPRPSLIHGDLWRGNWSCLADGEPVIFDPAVSLSDAEAELAMMELFGAPPAGFWPAYREALPVAAGYVRRRPVYQLVHILNHARLFGGGYARQALALCEAIAG
ncbi:MAG TPA: fructosamine kinase family protein [Burkholderiaceae bacterium]|nr:fructosamine kinase family protein [Burkholderiaceae bacterium]